MIAEMFMSLYILLFNSSVCGFDVRLEMSHISLLHALHESYASLVLGCDTVVVSLVGSDFLAFVRSKFFRQAWEPTGCLCRVSAIVRLPKDGCRCRCVGLRRRPPPPTVLQWGEG